MRHELRAGVLMLDALRHELRAASFVQNGAPPHEIQDEWRQSDQMAQAAERELQYGEQETEAGIREGRNDTSEPA